MTGRRTSIRDYVVGDQARFTKTVTETDASLFAAVSGDFYPIHFNEELARRTRFGGRIAHGTIAVLLADKLRLTGLVCARDAEIAQLQTQVARLTAALDRARAGLLELPY